MRFDSDELSADRKSPAPAGKPAAIDSERQRLIEQQRKDPFRPIELPANFPEDEIEWSVDNERTLAQNAIDKGFDWGGPRVCIGSKSQPGCGRIYMPAWNFQRKCWTCRMVKEDYRWKDARSQFDLFVNWLESMAAIQELPENADETIRISLGQYGEIRCTPRERLAAQLYAAGADFLFIAFGTGIGIDRLLSLQAGRAKPKGFPQMLDYYHEQFVFLTQQSAIRTLKMELLAARDEKDKNRQLSYSSILAAEAKIADMQNELLKLRARRGANQDAAGAERSLADLIPPDDKVEDIVTRITSQVFRSQQAGGPRR